MKFRLLLPCQSLSFLLAALQISTTFASKFNLKGPLVESEDSTSVLQRLDQCKTEIVPGPVPQNIHRIAICSAGHARSFYRMSMPHALMHNLIDAVPNGGEADLFLFAHVERGQPFGDRNKEQLFKTTAEEIAALEKALLVPGLRIKYKEIHHGSTPEELVRSFKKDNMTLLDDIPSAPLIEQKRILTRPHDQGRSGDTLASAMQFLWMYRCFDKVQQVSTIDGRAYDLIVRTRPDILLFAQLPWSTLQMSKLNYMPRWQFQPANELRNFGGEDWFFAATPSVLSNYMAPLREKYIYLQGLSLDQGGFFPVTWDASPWAVEARSHLAEVVFPVTILRGSGLLECERVDTEGRYIASLQISVLAKAYRRQCECFRTPNQRLHSGWNASF